MAAYSCSILLKAGCRPLILNRVLALVVFTLLVCSLGLPRTSTADTRLGILPRPDSILIRLTGQTPALIQEKRMVSLTKGINQIAFSWSGVHLDKDTILLTPLSDANDVRILSTAFPPDGTRLIWEVYSSRDRLVPLVISCLPAGLDHLISYTAFVDAKEQAMDLDTHLVLRNFSGQDFPGSVVWLNPDTLFHTDLQHLETRRFTFSTGKNITITKIHAWDGQTMPHDPKNLAQAPGIPFGYRITNLASTNQAARDLLPGKVRIFMTDVQGRPLFSGEDVMGFLPEGDTFFLQTGNSRDILVSKRRMNTTRSRVRHNDKGEIQVFDQKITDRFVLENTKSTPAVVTIRDNIAGQWEPVDMGHAYTLEDYQTLVFEIRLDAREKKTIDLTYTMLNIFAGNFKQYNTVAQ
jgi:hypothetical protein